MGASNIDDYEKIKEKIWTPSPQKLPIVDQYPEIVMTVLRGEKEIDINSLQK